MNRGQRIKRRLQMRAPLWAARAAWVLPEARGGGATLLVPPTRPGSLGDEAMMTACMGHLHREAHPFGVVDFAPGDRWPGEPPGTRHVDLSGLFGAAYLRSVPDVIRILRDFDRLWCLGADVMDGHYSEVGSLRRVALVHLAAELSLETSVLGFSFNENPSELVVEAMRALPASVVLHARDPISHGRLVQRLGRPVKLVADVAFGLEPGVDLNEDERELLRWVRDKRSEGHRVLGLNVSHRAFKSAGDGDVAQAIGAYASTLTDLLTRRRNLSIVCVPHDYRGSSEEMSDLELLATIVGRVDRVARERILLPRFRLSAPFVKRLVGEVDAVSSGRMHLVIAALGEGTPASGLSYQGKLAGLYAHFGLPDLGLDPSDATESFALLAAFDRLLDDNAELSIRIAESKSKVRALQRANFETGQPSTGANRLLVISPEATHPTDKGNRARIMDLCNRAERLGWEVHLAHIERSQTDRGLMYAHWGARYHPIPYRYPMSVSKRAVRRLRGAITKDYELGIDDWYDDDVEPHLQALHRRYSFDAVMVEYAHQSKAFELFGNDVLKVLDTHDELARRFARQEAFGQRRTGFSTTPEREAVGLSRSDVALAIQDLERERFQSRTRTEVVTVGHCVELVLDAAEKPFERRILFLGSRNQANVDGVRFFLDEVWPAIASQAKLLIAGSICEVVDIPPGVEQMPVVEDLASAYDLADIVVVPIRFGTGLKIKTIEALGRGKPTVSTPVGAEGLETGHGEALLVADGPHELTSALRMLLREPERRKALSLAATEFARKWNADSEAAFAAVLGRAVAAQAAD